MKDDISQLLRAARLPEFARLYQQWRGDPGNADKSHDDLLRFLAADYLQWKLSRRVAAFMRRAHLPKSVSLLNVTPCPGLSARRLANLGRCGWLSGGRNLVIIGESATDNTFLAGALAREAICQTTSVQWRRMITFVDQCSNAKQDELRKTMKTLSRARLLVLDGFAENVTPASAAAFLTELLDARTAAGLVTIVASARPVEEWDTLFQDPKVANALFHRVLDRAEVIELEHAQTMETRKPVKRQRVHRAVSARTKTPRRSIASR